MRVWETEEFLVAEGFVTIAVVEDLLDVEKFLNRGQITRKTADLWRGQVIEAAVKAEEDHFGALTHMVQP